MTDTMWGGRFEGNVDAFTQAFGASLEADRSMASQDILGSRAHARMLAERGIITPDDRAAIDAGLADIAAEIEAGAFAWDDADEDIHMAVERALTERVGSAGARLHTARSRNDQVATDLRLLARDQAIALMDANLDLRDALISVAWDNRDVVMPGYTHLQHAQPVTLAHHLLAYAWMLERDFERLHAAFVSANASPLGSAALAGTTYPISQRRTAALLGFDHVIPNSLDAVSDRDFLLDLTYACAVAMAHLSRLCEELVLWSSSEFGFVTLSDAYSTGSSIMPQKKNPDFAELVRGKTGRVYGDLVALLTTLKGLPLAYNKDLQECKEGPLDATRTLADCMAVVGGMVSTMRVNADAMAKAAAIGFTAATDMADYLAKRGLPFREAHAVVGRLVLACEQRGIGLEDLTLAELHEASPLFDDSVMGTLDPAAIAAARNNDSGTGSVAVKGQWLLARAAFRDDCARYDNARASVADTRSRAEKDDAW